MKVGDLVKWPQGHYDIPGLVLDVGVAASTGDIHTVAMNPTGAKVLAMMPELNSPEWFHECELEVISEEV